MKETGKSGRTSGGKQESKSRKDRRSASGMSGSPKKGGHGGKFTWAGGAGFSNVESGLGKDKALEVDANDPNFEEPAAAAQGHN